jgi:predicted protein tyrosine phosphatase
MPSIHVCPLHLVPGEALRLMPSGLVTLLSPGNAPPETPAHLSADGHLQRFFNDISEEQPDLAAPSEGDVAAIIAFARGWDRKAPMLIHCYAGISRSTAAAYITACVVRPDLAETLLADRLRVASPTATPNARMIAYADAQLERDFRMIGAIEAIGLGAFAGNGVPFQLRVV